MSAEVKIWYLKLGCLAGRCYGLSAEVAEIWYLKLGCLAGGVTGCLLKWQRYGT